MVASNGTQERLHAIKHAVSSTATCTSSTVAEIQNLLQTAREEQDSSSTASGGKQIKKPTQRARGKLLTEQVSRPGNKVRNVERVQDNCNLLSDKQRFVFATEIINITLKVLTEAIKNPSTENHTDTSNDSTQSKRSISVQKSAKLNSTQKQRPLQNRSHNRVYSSPARLSKSESREINILPRNSGLIAISECTEQSFICLRALETSKNSDIDMPPLQLEKGTSALIGKLMGLGFLEKATREIRILRRRLVAFVTQTATIRGPDTLQDVASSSKNTLTDLLDFGPVDVKGPLLDLVIQTQIQVLKLLNLTGKQICFNDLTKYLGLKNPGSPIQLLLRPKTEATHVSKTSQSLETISQLLLRISLKVLDQEHTEPLQLGEESMEPAFRMYCLGLEVRMTWWKIEEHSADIWREILGPFSKIMSKYLCHAKIQAPKKIELAQSQLASMCQCQAIDMTNVESKKDTYARNIQLRIIGTLATFAQTSGLIDDAIKWTNLMVKILEGEPGSDSDARLSSYLVRAANLNIQYYRQQQSGLDVPESISKVLERLHGNIKGETADLENLAAETISLRKAALSILNSHNFFEAIPESKSSSTKDKINEYCRRIILDTVSFFLKYLGPTLPDDNTSAKDAVRYNQRKSLIIKWAPQSVDGSFWLIKNLIDHTAISWVVLDSAVQDCLGLLSVLGLDLENDLAPGSPTRFLKASNLYWTYFQKLRVGPSRISHTSQLRCVVRSVETLKNRSGIEQSAGLLAVKLERLSNLLESGGKIRDSVKASTDALLVRITSDVASDLSNAMGKMSLHSIWQINDNMRSVERILCTLSRQATDLTTETGAYKQILAQTNLDQGIQGGMLEWILGQATQRMVSHRREVPNSFIMGLCKEIYENYRPYQHSVRRLRVLVLLSWLRFAWSDIPDIATSVDAEEDEEITSKGTNNYSDQGLERFLPQLRSSISIFRQLREDFPDAVKLAAEVHSFSSLVAEAVAEGNTNDKLFDVALLSSQLRILSDWAGLHGQDFLRTSTLNLIVQIDMLQTLNASSDRLVSDLLNLGEQLLLQGYSIKAGSALEKASDVVKQSQVSSASAFSIHLAYAEYYNAVGKPEKSAKSLAEAQGMAEQDESIMLQRKSSDIPDDRIQANALIARAWSAQSLVAFQQDDFGSAIMSGKQALRLFHRNWSYLSQSLPNPNPKSKINDKNSGAEVGTASEEEYQTPPVTALKNPTLTGLDCRKSPELWHGALSLFRAAQNQSDLYRHQGLLREALYYCEQAQRVADAAKSNILVAQNLAFTGDLLVRSGKYSEGNALLLKARPLMSGSEYRREDVAIHCAFGNFYRTQRLWQEELVEYEKAEAALERLTQHQLQERDMDSGKPMASVERGFSKLSIEEKSVKKPIRRVDRKQPSAKAKKTAAVQGPGKVQTEPDTTLNISFQLSRSKQVVLQKKAITLLAQQQPDLAKSVLREAESLSQDRLVLIDQKLAFAKLMLFQGISDMIADAVFCVLQDSTISFPSTARMRRNSDRPKLEGRHAPGTIKSPTAVISRKTVERSRTPADENFLDFLQIARDGLASVLPVVLKSCSTATIHALTKSLASISMLESAAMSGKAEQSLHPVALSYTLEMARMTAIHREQAIERTERRASTQELSSKWPMNKSSEQSKIGRSGLPTDFTEFQQNYIDIIPPKWTAISISLNESGTELFLSKMQAGQSPFLLRLPLSRHSSRDADDEEFDFDQGKAELLDIIASANRSTQDARDMTKKGAKSAWWAVREGLDSRLKDLLLNIQSIWIGGFRGLFSQEPRREQLLGRFNQSFQVILNKHLPSRARVKRNKKVETVLDTRILELLVGLGDPGEDGDELEEPLTDLLYFIIDILQFNGERNAYDEIDFDNIIIETLDAIRKYYDELKSESSSSNGMHTVLILDQALYGFPWESLPCLDGLSISRLPSLACLRERILLQQNHENQPQYDGHRINRENGTFVLNPSGDLKNTESTFSSSFSDLKGWTSIVGRAPEETEIQNALLESQLYLYFGHGGGEQYIRARSIKKLEKCAVSLLMGCSSGAMIDAVEFEPYGTPRNYMLAGCPALVATLWDVTDKDIDRFAQDVFCRWGLLDGPKENKSDSKKKGKKRENMEGPVSDKEQGKNSLTEAVARSRESCVLRYLNGAAPVVYGIPVYLD